MTFEKTMKGRSFKVNVKPAGMKMLEITAYEIIHPNWKIFRANPLHFVWKIVSVTDYDDIMRAVESVLTVGFIAEAEEKETIEKWKNFEKSLDKPMKM